MLKLSQVKTEADRLAWSIMGIEDLIQSDECKIIKNRGASRVLNDLIEHDRQGHWGTAAYEGWVKSLYDKGHNLVTVLMIAYRFCAYQYGRAYMCKLYENSSEAEKPE